MIDINNEEFMEKLIINSVRLINYTSETCVKSEATRGGLTTPQINVMMELMIEDGLSLKALSERLNLSHSTVSGIIDRLETKGAVVRRQDTSDGRFTRIFLSEKVYDYNKNIALKRYLPFIDAIKKAQPDEKVKILEGLSILCRLLK